MEPTLKDYIWTIRLFPNYNHNYVLEKLFYYDCSNDETFSFGQMGACIPQKEIQGTDEDIEYVHNNWETLLENNIAIVQYENGFWKVDLRYVKSG